MATDRRYDSTRQSSSTEEENDAPVETETEALERGEWWTGIFWTVLGLLTIAVTLPLFGLRYEILFPALVLTGYGLFVLWNPPFAQSDAPWTGTLWVTLGIGLLLLVQLFDFHWTIEVNGIIIGFFLVFIGILVVLDL